MENKTIEIGQLRESIPSRGTFIILIHPERIPPHLGIISNRSYYSIHVDGPKVGLPSTFISKLISKGLPILLFKTIELLESDIKAVIQESSLIEGNTCLKPLKELHNDKTSETIHEFISKNIHQVQDTIGINISTKEVVIPAYSKEDILNYISSLKND